MNIWEKARIMMNTAETISTINNTEITRMDLNQSQIGEIKFYNLDIWYSDGKHIRLRQDCTLVE